MNGNYIKQALEFHGQPLQKIWEDERGVDDLPQWGVQQHLSFDIYKERQRFFTFQDRAKRLKLHQFIARKSLNLYDKELLSPAASGIITYDENDLQEAKNSLAVIPPYEVHIRNHELKLQNYRYILNLLKPGQIICGTVSKYGPIKPLCTAEPPYRFLDDLPIKGYIQASDLKALPLDKSGKPTKFQANDYICCEILDNDDSVNGLRFGLLGTLTKNKNIKLGLISYEDLPEYYRKVKTKPGTKYEDMLIGSKEWQSPCFDILYKLNGLSPNEHCSLMNYFQPGFPKEDYASVLRQKQASRWAYSSLTEGIGYFRSGNHVEAFQCLNRALKIDPNNVEGLVARGALFANQGAFKPAIDDFDKALKVNEKHPNARKYLCETMVALGRSHAEEKQYDKALKAYNDVFQYIPDYPEAVNAIKELKLLMASAAQANSFGLAPTVDLTENLLQLSSKPSLLSDPFLDEDIVPPAPRISTNFSDKVQTIENISSSSSESDKFMSKEKTRTREVSLSPLSKRMALHDASMKAQVFQSFSQPFFSARPPSTLSTPTIIDPSIANEFKLDDDDTEQRVRDLLQGALKHKKEKHKSKKKKSKKSKRDSPDSVERLSRKKSDSPPPKAPSMTLPSSTNTISFGSGSFPDHSISLNGRSTVPKPKAQAQNDNAPKLSFQIRPQIKLDKFGLYRLAAPLDDASPNRKDRHLDAVKMDSPSRDRYNRRSHSRSRHRSDSRSRRGRRHSYSRSRSNSPSRRRHRRSRSRSSGRTTHRRRRTPSPFVPRSPPPSKERSPIQSGKAARRRRKNNAKNFGNLVWKRPGLEPTVEQKPSHDDKNPSGRWLHDKYEEEEVRFNASNNDDGPTIEEIDEIITKAQKERKEEIIKRDKEILKKR